MPLKRTTRSSPALTTQVEIWKGIEQIYSPEKTLADCFKFRNKIGMDVMLEALKLYKIRKEFKSGEILKYAEICRFENIMRPYLEMSA